MAAVPNATIVGFTGTRIDKTTQGEGTFKIFGYEDEKSYLDKYLIRNRSRTRRRCRSSTSWRRATTEKFPAGTIFLCAGAAPLVDSEGQVVKGSGPVSGAPDPANGGIYALTKDEIANNKLPPPVDGDLGALDGLHFTAGSVMLNTQIRGDVPHKVTVNCPNEPATTLALEPGGEWADLTGPADLAVRRSADGPQLIVVPELFARDARPGDDEVTVLAVSDGFDAACQG